MHFINFILRCNIFILKTRKSCNQGNYDNYTVADMVAVGAWLHQQAGLLASEDVSEMGVDGVTLAEYIKKTIRVSCGV